MYFQPEVLTLLGVYIVMGTHSWALMCSSCYLLSLLNLGVIARKLFLFLKFNASEITNTTLHIPQNSSQRKKSNGLNVSSNVIFQKCLFREARKKSLLMNNILKVLENFIHFFEKISS